MKTLTRIYSHKNKQQEQANTKTIQNTKNTRYKNTKTITTRNMHIHGFAISNKEMVQREENEDEAKKPGNTLYVRNMQKVYQKQQYLTIHRANKPQCKKEWLKEHIKTTSQSRMRTAI